MHIGTLAQHSYIHIGTLGHIHTCILEPWATFIHSYWNPGPHSYMTVYWNPGPHSYMHIRDLIMATFWPADIIQYVMCMQSYLKELFIVHTYILYITCMHVHPCTGPHPCRHRKTSQSLPWRQVTTSRAERNVSSPSPTPSWPRSPSPPSRRAPVQAGLTSGTSGSACSRTGHSKWRAPNRTISTTVSDCHASALYNIVHVPAWLVAV